MPVDIVVYRKGSDLAPASAADDAVIVEKVPLGKYVTITISEPKGDQDRWYWGLVGKIAEGYGCETSPIHRALMEATNRFENEYVDEDGKVIRRSLQSTAKWDGIEWRDYIREMTPIVLAVFLPNMTESKLRSEIERYVGVDLSKIT